MPNGELYPFLSQKTVRMALDGLVHPTVSTVSPLESLLLVDQFLANPDFPATAGARSFAVHYILTTMITEQLRRHRRALSLTDPELEMTPVTGLEALQADAAHRGPDLIGWSLLYHRYVRVDLHLNIERLLETIAVDERTLRRYQNHAIGRLTERLIAAEWQARIQQRKRRLYAALPAAFSPPLIDRQEAFAQWRAVSESVSMPRHILVTGPAGIGKTAFVQEAIRQQIDAEKLDQLVWLEHPISFEFIYHYLNESLLSEGSRIQWREYLLLYNTAFVLDGVEHLLPDHRRFDHLLEALSAAFVVLTSAVFYPLSRVITHIALHELSASETSELVRVATMRVPDADMSAEALRVWERVGGNPLAVRLMAQDITFSKFDLDVAPALGGLYDALYAQLSPPQRRAWVAFALLPDEGIEPENLYVIWSHYIQMPEVGALMRHYIIEPVREKLRLLTSARGYIHDGWQHNADIQANVSELIAALDLFLAHDPTTTLPIIQYLLLTNFIGGDESLALRWVNLAWKHGIRRGHYAIWRSILERYQTTSLELSTAFGVCLRRLGDWSAAQEVFLKTIHDSGNQGKFLEQAKALIEWSILLRYQGNYLRAIECLDKAQRTISRSGDLELQRYIFLERAQIALDSHDSSAAKECLTDIVLHDGRSLALLAEAHILAGDWQTGRAFAQQAAGILANDKAALARVYTIVGRSHELEGDLDGAHTYFANALTLLESSEDPFALARAQCNLGALLMRETAYKEAEQLLKSAETIQSKLGDRVALAGTRHNLRLLQTLIGG
jgi:tetratricopeptide (TPR) repeat protein